MGIKKVAQVFETETYEPHFPGIEPMRMSIPQWYKDAEQYIGGKPQISPESNNALKVCVPFLDSLTTGYAIPLFCDIVVEKVDGKHFFSWRDGDFAPLGSRDKEVAPTLPVPVGHSTTHYSWQLKVALRLPKGYSALITHPLNRNDLPFTTLSGVVDPNFALHGGNLPFFLREDFEGVLQKGTPIAQIIPFKTEDWVLQVTPGLSKEAMVNSKRSRSVISGWYKRTHWKKKSYN
jgi:hypothetical protein